MKYLGVKIHKWFSSQKRETSTVLVKKERLLITAASILARCGLGKPFWTRPPRKKGQKIRCSTTAGGPDDSSTAYVVSETAAGKGPKKRKIGDTGTAWRAKP